MNADRPDSLDQAIDEVARQLVSAPRDRDMAARIAAALPPRRLPWFRSAPRWVVHGAGVAVVIATAVTLWTGRGPSTVSHEAAMAQPLQVAPVGALARYAAALEMSTARARGTRVIGTPTAPVAAPDHEHALSPVDDPVQIAVAALDTGTLNIAPAALEPLTLDALVDGGAPSDPKEQ